MPPAMQLVRSAAYWRSDTRKIDVGFGSGSAPVQVSCTGAVLCRIWCTDSCSGLLHIGDCSKPVSRTRIRSKSATGSHDPTRPFRPTRVLLGPGAKTGSARCS